jgi:hypothetical protein
LTVIDITQQPYFDRYDPTKLYNWVLIHPGRNGQASEIVELQHLFYEMMSRVFTKLFQDGYVLDGCTVAQSTTPGIITVNSGHVFLQGKVHYVPLQQLTISTVGTVVVGPIIQQTIIDYTSDFTLNDPAIGSPNYNLPGADRLKEQVLWEVNNVSTPALASTFTFVNGALTSTLQGLNIQSLMNLTQIQLSGGSIITGHLAGTQSLTFPAIAANSSNVQTITITGASVGDNCYSSPSGDVGTNLVWSSWVSSANTISIRLANPTTASITPTVQTWRAGVWKH